MANDQSELGGGAREGLQPFLTSEFHKARRQLMLFSALLLAWELIGIDLDPEQPLPYLNVKLRSPEVAPWIFIVLMGYFSARVAIEWFKSPADRRQHPASKADIALCISIVLLSIIVFVAQILSKVQIVDLMFGIGPWVLGIATNLIFNAIVWWRAPKELYSRWVSLVISLICAGILGYILLHTWNQPMNIQVDSESITVPHWKVLLPFAVSGGLFGIPMFVIMRVTVFSRIFIQQASRNSGGADA